MRPGLSDSPQGVCIPEHIGLAFSHLPIIKMHLTPADAGIARHFPRAIAMDSDSIRIQRHNKPRRPSAIFRFDCDDMFPPAQD